MSFGFGFSLPSWHTLSGGFSPASLFSNGEEGVWYDPSDYSTLFQESTGVTHVTAVEQAVGLMLDKRKGGGPLGSDTVVNGTFAADADWTKGTDWTIGSGVATKTAGTAASLSQAITLTAGIPYLVTYTITRTAGALTPQFTGGTTVSGAARSAAGTYTDIMVAVTGNTTLAFSADASFAGTIDNVTMRSMPAGNHAYQSSSTARPTLRARYNLLTYSDQFDTSPPWSKLNGVTVAASAVTPPISGASVSKLIAPNSTGSGRTLRQALTTGVSGVSYTASIYLKYVPGEFQWVRILSTDTGSVWFDIQNGVKGNETSATGTIANAGNGWWRCTVTSTASSANIYSYVNLVDADNSTTTTGDGVKGVLISAADLRPASQATGLIGPTYQRVAAATVYDSAGFLPYLSFDGNDSMQTNSIDFSAEDKVTVWAGVRKLSDANVAIVAELSSDISSNNGAFYLAAPVSTSTDNQAFASKGTSLSAASAGNVAPITNVLTGVGDISGDSAILRINAVQAATSSTDQGTGNYGNYPLYIGARAGTSLWFTGWLTSLIVRGAQSTTAQIEATESWVNGKTGAY